MEEKYRSSNPTTPVVLAAAAVLLFATLSIYVFGYFSLCRHKISIDDERYRLYAMQWQATIYKPAAMVESLATGKQVETGSETSIRKPNTQAPVPSQPGPLPGPVPKK